MINISRTMLDIPSKKSSSKQIKLPFPEPSEISLYEDLFWSTFSDLPHTCQKMLLLKWCDYSNTEISNKLGIAEDGIEERIIHCTRTFVSRVKSHRDYRRLKDTVLRD